MARKVSQMNRATRVSKHLMTISALMMTMVSTVSGITTAVLAFVDSHIAVSTLSPAVVLALDTVITMVVLGASAVTLLGTGQVTMLSKQVRALSKEMCTWRNS